MRYRRLFVIVIGLLLLGSAGPGYLSQSDAAATNVQLSVRSAKSTYVLGEIVKLTARIENRGAERVRVYVGRPHDNQGTFLYISRDGTSRGQYSNRYKESLDGRYVWIEPNSSFEKEFEILWNQKPDMINRSPLELESVTRGKILTDYVFPVVGPYLVKVVFWNVRDSRGQELPDLESQLEVRIEQPQGQDLVVWRLMENRPDIAYFLDNAWIDANDSISRERRWRELREIADRHPNSIIARQIGQKLQEFRTKFRNPLPWESPN